jgi:hypothetical protein
MDVHLEVVGEGTVRHVETAVRGRSSRPIVEYGPWDVQGCGRGHPNAIYI